MSSIDTSEANRAALLDATGYLAVSRDPAGQGRGPDDPATELFLLLDAQGRTNALNGHVDLGQGIRTALTQIVAEELDLAFERVTMLLGNVGTGPNQGGTIASETIQVTAPGVAGCGCPGAHRPAGPGGGGAGYAGGLAERARWHRHRR